MVVDYYKVGYRRPEICNSGRGGNLILEEQENEPGSRRCSVIIVST